MVMWVFYCDDSLLIGAFHSFITYIIDSLMRVNSLDLLLDFHDNALLRKKRHVFSSLRFSLFHLFARVTTDRSTQRVERLVLKTYTAILFKLRVDNS